MTIPAEGATPAADVVAFATYLEQARTVALVPAADLERVQALAYTAARNVGAVLPRVVPASFVPAGHVLLSVEAPTRLVRL